LSKVIGSKRAGGKSKEKKGTGEVRPIAVREKIGVTNTRKKGLIYGEVPTIRGGNNLFQTK